MPPKRQYFNLNSTSLERSLLVTVSRYGGKFGACRATIVATYTGTSSLTTLIQLGEDDESSSREVQIPSSSFLTDGSHFSVKIFSVELSEGSNVGGDFKPVLNTSSVNVFVPEIGANSVVSIVDRSKYVSIDMDYMTGFVTVTRLGLFASLRIPWQAGYPLILNNRPTRSEGEVDPSAGVLELKHGVREGVIQLKASPVQEPDKPLDFVIHLTDRIKPGTDERGWARLGQNIWSVMEPHGVVRIAPSSQTVMVREGSVARVKISRTFSTIGTVRVRYRTTVYTGPNPATPGSDFVPMTSSVDLTEGEFSKWISIQTLDDTQNPQPEQKERFFLQLLSVDVISEKKLSSSPRLSDDDALNTATVTILDNDNPYGSFSFASVSRSIVVDESSGSIKLTVERNGGALSSSTVDIVTLGGEETWTNQILASLANGHPVKSLIERIKDHATASLDYAPIQQQLVFQSRPASVKTDQQQINVNVFMDNINEPLEKFVVLIQNVTGGAQVFEPHSFAVVSVRANGFYNGEVGFEVSKGVLDEDAGTRLNLTVMRSGESRDGINVSLFFFNYNFQIVAFFLII